MNDLLEQAALAVESLLAFELNEIQKQFPDVEHNPAMFSFVVRRVSRHLGIGTMGLENIQSFQNAGFDEIDCVTCFKSGGQQISFYTKGTGLFSVYLSPERVERPCSGGGYAETFIKAVKAVAKELNRV